MKTELASGSFDISVLPSRGASPRSKQYLVASIACVTLLLTSFLAANVAKADQFSTASPDSAEVACRKTLPTSSGVRASVDDATSRVFVPRQWSGQLCVYLAAGMELLAPKGWSGRGAIGADGGRNAQLRSPATASTVASSIAVTDCSATFYCGAMSAAPLYAAVRDRWKSYDLGVPVPTPVPDLSVSEDGNAIGADTILYSLPKTRAGLIVNGVAYAGILSCKGTMFLQMQTTLPPGDSALAKIILEFYRQRYIERARRQC